MNTFLEKIKKYSFLEILQKILNRLKLLFVSKIQFKNFGTIKKLRSESDNGMYLFTVKQATQNEKKFDNFRSNLIYKSILEHVSYEYGLDYINIIKKESNLLDNINNFLINDEIGNPTRYFYDELKIKVAPTTLRYIKVASDIKKLFKDEINDIIEIGSGYGGQYLILDQVKKINLYTLVDLYDVTKLIEKYLECHLLNSSYETKTINQIIGHKPYDLVISNYAFSELPCETQMKYIQKVLLKSKNGYLTMNSGMEKSGLKKHLSLEEIKNYIKGAIILEEQPNTSEGNYIIIWGNINTEKI
jgi:putative sugar O-methyltransferase